LKTKPIILDCTLRDGGYYTNWKYKKNLIDDYLNFLKKLKIDLIEIGFRKQKQNKLGDLGFCNNQFLNKFSNYKNIVLMTDLKDLIQLNSNKEIEKLFTFEKTKPQLIRIAMLKDQLKSLSNISNLLKDLNMNVCINLMQISNCKSNDIKNFVSKLSKLKLNKILYFADTFGSCDSQDIKKIIKVIKDYSDFEIGIHAHNNMGRALSNTLTAYNEGAKYLDSTIMGMGRGAGNAQTEFLFDFFNGKNEYSEKLFTSLIYKHFYNLKKKYMWGPNYLYYLSAKKNIHPTYVQKINENDVNDNLIFNLIENSKSNNFKNYNDKKRKKLFQNNKFKRVIKKINNNDKILCLVDNLILKKNKTKIENFIKKNKPVVCRLNHNSMFESLTDYHFVTNRARISRDLGTLINFKKDIISTKALAKEFYDIINIKTINSKMSDNILEFFLEFCKHFKFKNIYFAGLKGFDKDKDFRNSINQTLLEKYKNIKKYSLTKTKYKLKYL
jgi:4-hydroxy 2-oxovalerate aldolase